MPKTKEKPAKSKLHHVLFTIALITIIFVIFGSIINDLVKKSVIQDFLESKVQLANYIASSLDSDEHLLINKSWSTKKASFKQYQKLLNNVFVWDKEISYIYTLNYDKTNNNVSYTVDGGIVADDTVWIESDFLAFTFLIKDWVPMLSYEDDDGVHYTQKYASKKDWYKIIVSITDNTLQINNTKIFDILAAQPLMIKPQWTTWNIENNQISEPIQVDTNKWNVDFFLSFTAKWQASSNPGTTYVDDDNVIASIKESIEKMTAMIRYTDGAYGEIISIYSPIIDKNWSSNALVWLDYMEWRVNDYAEDATQHIKIWFIFLYIITIFIITSCALWWEDILKKIEYITKKLKS